MRSEYLLSLLLYTHNSGILARAIRQEETKGTQIRKEEVKLFLFADDIVLCIKDLKNSTNKRKSS
jgi:hypothetical protein